MLPEYIEALKQSKVNKKSIIRQAKRFRKMRKAKVDDIIHPLHDAAFEKVDCLQCANCCKTTSPLFTERDITRISKHLGMTGSQFSQKYLKLDDDQEYVLTSAPCPFLNADNYCGVYDVRPKACSAYPHTDQVNQLGIMQLSQENANICPAVADIFNELAKTEKDLRG